MKYGITVLGLGYDQTVELTKEEYDDAIAAKQGVVAALSLEEKINLVLENYVEFELELLQLTTRQMIFTNIQWSKFVGELQLVNRRLVNLLTACRLYIDQTKHEISQLYGNPSNELSATEGALSAEYDSCLGYRVMEALRNHVQHQSLPVDRLTYKQARVEHGTDNRSQNLCAPLLSVTRLEEQKGFKAKVLAELKGQGDMVDLKPFARDYVVSLVRAHMELRKRIDGDVSQWDKKLQSVIDRFKEKFPGNPVVGLAVVTMNEAGDIQEAVHIFSQLIERRQELERKNHNARHLRTHFVSSAVLDEVSPPRFGFS